MYSLRWHCCEFLQVLRSCRMTILNLYVTTGVWCLADAFICVVFVKNSLQHERCKYESGSDLCRIWKWWSLVMLAKRRMTPWHHFWDPKDSDCRHFAIFFPQQITGEPWWTRELVRFHVQTSPQNWSTFGFESTLLAFKSTLYTDFRRCGNLWVRVAGRRSLVGALANLFASKSVGFSTNSIRKARTMISSSFSNRNWFFLLFSKIQCFWTFFPTTGSQLTQNLAERLWGTVGECHHGGRPEPPDLRRGDLPLWGGHGLQGGRGWCLDMCQEETQYWGIIYINILQI